LPYTFHLAERDDAGAQILSGMRYRGISRVAIALAQSADHVLSFFKLLRRELALHGLPEYPALRTFALRPVECIAETSSATAIEGKIYRGDWVLLHPVSYARVRAAEVTEGRFLLVRASLRDVLGMPLHRVPVGQLSVLPTHAVTGCLARWNIRPYRRCHNLHLEIACVV
jgi:hypothetical protein